LRVNDQPIDSMTAIQQEIQSNLGKSTVITFQRNGQTEQVTLVPRSNPPEGQGAIGIEMGNPTKPISLLAALPIGAVTTYEHIKLLLTFPIQILQKQVPAQSGRLVGFKGMFDIYQEVRQTPTTSNIPPGVNLMGYFATITISLGILNLLPIPALDGGRILFVLPEIILRRRIPPAYENAINLVSFALLLILLLYINLQDFINPIQLPH
jgi:regulator of sigma E protease